MASRTFRGGISTFFSAVGAFYSHTLESFQRLKIGCALSLPTNSLPTNSLPTNEWSFLMRCLLLFLALSLFTATLSSTAEAQTTTMRAPSTAQQDAETMARTGILQHCGRAGGAIEGIGFGQSRESAIKNCCYWGQRKPREVGTCRGHRGWFACVRYW